MAWEDCHRAWRRSAPTQWEALPSARSFAPERRPSLEPMYSARDKRSSVSQLSIDPMYSAREKRSSVSQIPVEVEVISPVAAQEAASSPPGGSFEARLIENGWFSCGIAIGEDIHLRNSLNGASPEGGEKCLNHATGVINRLRECREYAVAASAQAWTSPDGLYGSSVLVTPRDQGPCVVQSRARTLSPPKYRLSQPGQHGHARRPSGGVVVVASGSGTPLLRSPRHSRQGSDGGYRRSPSAGPGSLQPVPVSAPSGTVIRFRSVDGPGAAAQPQPQPAGPPPHRTPSFSQARLPPEGPIITGPPPEAQIVTAGDYGASRVPRVPPASWEQTPHDADQEPPRARGPGNGVRRRTTPAEHIGAALDRLDPAPIPVTNGAAPLPSPLPGRGRSDDGCTPGSEPPPTTTTPLPPMRKVRASGLPRHSAAATATFTNQAQADAVTFTGTLEVPGEESAAASAASGAPSSAGRPEVSQPHVKLVAEVEALLDAKKHQPDDVLGDFRGFEDCFGARRGGGSGLRSGRSTASGSLTSRSNPQEALTGPGAWALSTVDKELAAEICATSDLAQLERLTRELPQELTAGPTGPKPAYLGTWMIWMVHRILLDDPELQELDFSTYGMPAGDEEPRIAQKLFRALHTSKHIRSLLLGDCNVLAACALRPEVRDEQVENLAATVVLSRTLRVLDVSCNFFGSGDLQALFHALERAGKNSSLEELRCGNQFCGEPATKDVFRVVDKALKQNTSLRKLGMDLTDAHWRDQITRGLIRNVQAARKRRCSKKAQAGPELAEMAAFVSRLMGADAGGA